MDGVADDLAPVNAPADLLDDEVVDFLIADDIFFRKARDSARNRKALPAGFNALASVERIGLRYLLVDALL